MLMNNLDPEVAERPEDLVVYGGTGRAARSWEAFDAIVARAARARRRRDAAGAVGQAGRRLPHPRRRAARADRQRQPGAGVGDLGDVPRSRGSRPDDVRPDDRRQLDLHRHAGHPAGHLRDAGGAGGAPLRRHAGRPAHRHGRSRRHGRRPAAGGDDERRRGAGRRGRSGADRPPPGHALPRRGDRLARRGAGAVRRVDGRPASPARSRCAATPPRCCRRWSRAASCPTWSPTRPRRTTRSTATCPTGCRWPQAAALRAADPARLRGAQRRGDGPARRGDAGAASGAARSCSTTATTSAPRRCRPASPTRSRFPASCPSTSGRCSAKARARSAGRRSRAIRPTSGGHRRRPRSRCSPATRRCAAGFAWRRSGSRSRACRRGSAGSATASARASGCGSTSWCASGAVSAPIVIGRDHLDAGSVASPNRETEGMRDGSDAIADWPMLNALLNTAAGATWVSVHHGGGVGIGYSLHAGMVVVADGTRRRRPPARARAHLRSRHGVIRHADAGYPGSAGHGPRRAACACRWRSAAS